MDTGFKTIKAIVNLITYEAKTVTPLGMPTITGIKEAEEGIVLTVGSVDLDPQGPTDGMFVSWHDAEPGAFEQGPLTGDDLSALLDSVFDTLTELGAELKLLGAQ